MPWIYNPTPELQTAQSMSGAMLAFPPRKKTYVKPEQMSAYVWNLVRERKLASRGGDPVVSKPNAPQPAPVKIKTKADLPISISAVSSSVDLDTSSSHHSTHAKISNESQGSGPAKKSAKAVKKQSDIQKKDTQSNSKEPTKANAAEIPSKRRRASKRKS